MRKPLVAFACSLGVLLFGGAAALAVYNGSADGTGHPAVGFVLGTIGTDPCDYDAQAIGCSGVLIAPDIFLTTADCADSIKDSIATGFIDDGWVILDADPLVPGAPEATLDCSKFVHIDTIDLNPVAVSSGGSQGDVGVMILASAQSITPATLPAENRLKPKPKKRLPDITTVSFGELPGTSGFDIFTLARRFSHAVFGAIGAESHVATLDAIPGPDDPCVGFLTRGGPNFVTGTNQIVSLAKYPATTCDTTATFQRLDVPSVRSFLSSYVTLP